MENDIFFKIFKNKEESYLDWEYVIFKNLQGEIICKIYHKGEDKVTKNNNGAIVYTKNNKKHSKDQSRRKNDEIFTP